MKTRPEAFTKKSSTRNKIWTHLLTFASTFHNRDQYQDISNGSDDAADEHEDISLLE